MTWEVFTIQLVLGLFVGYSLSQAYLYVRRWALRREVKATLARLFNLEEG